MITLREKIMVALTHRPGLSERELAAETHGEGSAPQLVKGECRRMVRLGLIERRREGGAFRNYLRDTPNQIIANSAVRHPMVPTEPGKLPETLTAMVNTVLDGFIKAIAVGGSELTRDMIEVDVRPAPHKQPSELPPGRMAVYAFFHERRCLKCGKVGPNSGPRYTSQHYAPGSAKSTLASSILKCGEFGVTEDNVGVWIKANTDRINLLLSAGQPSAIIFRGISTSALEPAI